MDDATSDVVVRVQGVSRVFGRARSAHRALCDVSFVVQRGETLAVIGESGAGKSTLVRVIAGLERPTSGTVEVCGAPVSIHHGVPGPAQIVFQNPLSALNPFHSIGRSVAEPMRRLQQPERRRRVWELLASVGMDPKRAGDRPGRFSGGQLQRVVIARALAAEPKVLLCDEPTSSLDVSVQSQILNLLMELQDARRFACILVSHDLAVAKILADDVLVLRHGAILEYAPSATFFTSPQNGYSQELLSLTFQPTQS